MSQFVASDLINGQFVPVSPAAAIFPVGYGPSPLQNSTLGSVPQQPPMQAANSGNTADVANVSAAAMAEQVPFSLKASPLWWSIGFLLVGLLGLRLVHWS